MRSMRASRSVAVTSDSTVNGSTGARRKRDFVFMPPIIIGPSLFSSSRLPVFPSSERVAEPSERGGAIAAGDGIARPRGATGDRDAQRVDDDEIQRELAARGVADVGGAEGAIPRVPGVGKHGAVHRAHEHRKGAGAALDTAQ